MTLKPFYRNHHFECPNRFGETIVGDGQKAGSVAHRVFRGIEQMKKTFNIQTSERSVTPNLFKKQEI